MSAGRIDREAWAQEISDLITQFDPGPRGGGNKSAFSRRIGLTTRTIDRWLASQTDVSPDSVRTVADKLGLPQHELRALLTRIGYLDAAGFPAPPAVPDPHADPIIREIMADPRLTENQRADLVRIQLARIEADLFRRRDEYVQLRAVLGDREAS